MKNLRGDEVPSITRAAIYTPYKIYVGEEYQRHHHIISAMRADGRTAQEIAEAEQGFLTSDKEFVTRWQAYRIAFDAGQVTKMPSLHTELYSEDVW